MKLSLQGAKLIRIREGTRTATYRDSTGTLTIGCGFTWGSASFRKWWAENKQGKPFALGETMSLDQIDQCMILMADDEYSKAVNDFLGNTPVEQHVFDAMVSMVWNCGTGSLKWNWAQQIKLGNLKTACDFWRTTATKSKGVELKGLITRRNDEADQALHGYGTVSPQIPSTPEPLEKFKQLPVKTSWLASIIKSLFGAKK